MQHPKLAMPGAAASLPVHPTTGLPAIGWRRNGDPIWPIAGGDGTGDPPPGAPGAVPPAAVPPVPPAPPTPPAPGQDPTTPVDVESLPPNVRKLITDLRNENGTRRTAATTAAQEKKAAEDRLAAVLKAAGLNPDGTPATDPEKAAADLAQRAQAAEDAAWTSTVQLGIHQMAGRLGGDADRLLDSRRFVDSLDDLPEDDPTSDKFKTALEAKVKDWLTAHPEFKAAPAGPPRSGGPLPGGPGTPPERSTSLGAAIRETLQAKAR
jgi:hypothetical protein